MYHKHGVKLSKAQAHSLAKGQTIRLSHGHLQGPHEVHLTKTQLKKMQRSHANRVGTEIKLSGAQLRHNYKHGAGFLDLLKAGAKALAPVAIDAASSFVKNKVAGMGVRSKKKQGGEGLFDWAGPLADGLNSVGNQVVDNAVPLAIMAATHGAGVKSKRKVKGDGFMDFIKAGAKALAPMAIDAGTTLLKNKIAGSGVRSKKRTKKGQHGGSFLPVGY